MCFGASMPKPKAAIPPPMSPDEGVQSAGDAQRQRIKSAQSGNQTIFNIGGAAGLPGGGSTTAAPKATTGA